MCAEMQPGTLLVQCKEGAGMFYQTRRAGSSFTPTTWSLAPQASSICFKTRHLLAVVEGLAVLQVDSYSSHQTQTSEKWGGSHFDVQLCTDTHEISLFYPEVLWWLLSKVAVAAVESFPIRWCLYHQAGDGALALNEVNMRGSSSSLLGWWCTSLSPTALTIAGSEAKAEVRAVGISYCVACKTRGFWSQVVATSSLQSASSFSTQH